MLNPTPMKQLFAEINFLTPTRSSPGLPLLYKLNVSSKARQKKFHIVPSLRVVTPDLARPTGSCQQLHKVALSAVTRLQPKQIDRMLLPAAQLGHAGNQLNRFRIALVAPTSCQLLDPSSIGL